MRLLPLLAALYRPPRKLGHVVPLLLPRTHVQHAVGGAHRSLRKRRRLHADVGDAFAPFSAGGVVLALDGAFEGAEGAGAAGLGGGDEAGGGEVLLRLLGLLLPCCWGCCCCTSLQRAMLIWMSCATHAIGVQMEGFCLGAEGCACFLGKGHD